MFSSREIGGFDNIEHTRFCIKFWILWMQEREKEREIEREKEIEYIYREKERERG